MKVWRVTADDGSTYNVEASDAAAAITCVVGIWRIYEHRQIVKVKLLKKGKGSKCR